MNTDHIHNHETTTTAPHMHIRDVISTTCNMHIQGTTTTTAHPHVHSTTTMNHGDHGSDGNSGHDMMTVFINSLKIESEI
jgi:hypothetical protein